VVQRWRAIQRNDADDTPPLAVPDAGRVGTARRDVAGWPRTTTARQVTPIPVGVYRDHQGSDAGTSRNLIVPPGDASGETRTPGVWSRSFSLRLGEFQTDRSWVRDSGPIFVVNESGEKAAIDWPVNAWQSTQLDP